MKLIHLSDLHIGKRVNEYPMLDDQKYILKKIINIVDEEKPDGILIAGDVYDKTVPSAEAVQVFDDFLVDLAKRKQNVFIISGNHDSAERLAFGSRIMDASGIHFSPVYKGMVDPITLTDDFGAVNIYLLPFLKPQHVRQAYEDEVIESYTDAMRCAIAHMEVNENERNVLVTHQFVTGAERTDSEDLSVGGADNVDASVFAPFDYVALGHIHRPQNCGAENIRYCGTPLKYSFSEAKDHKSVTVVEMGNKGKLVVRQIPLEPLHDMVELKGTYSELTAKPFYEKTTWQEDYTHITLTDEEDIPDAVRKLSTIYHRLMKLDYDNKRTRTVGSVEAASDVEKKKPVELFADLFEKQNNQPMSEEQQKYMETLMEKIWEVK